MSIRSRTSNRSWGRDSISSSVPDKPNKKKIMVASIVMVIGLAIFFITWGGAMKDKADMQEYLRNKYGQEFEIRDIKTRDSGLGIPGLRVGTAHPTADNSLTFEVGKSKSTSKYFDGYSGAVWEREERPRVASFLETIYGQSAAPSFDLRTHIPTATDPDPIQGAVPPIDEALAKYKDNFLYLITVQVTSNHELSPSEIKNHTAYIEQVREFVLSKGTSHPIVRYAINIEDEDAGYLCHLSEEKLLDQDEVRGCLVKKSGKVW